MATTFHITEEKARKAIIVTRKELSKRVSLSDFVVTRGLDRTNSSSAHFCGDAIDISRSKTAKDLIIADLLALAKSDFDQIIIEKEANSAKRWYHFGYRLNGRSHRHMIMLGTRVNRNRTDYNVLIRGPEALRYVSILRELVSNALLTEQPLGDLRFLFDSQFVTDYQNREAYSFITRAIGGFYD